MDAAATDPSEVCELRQRSGVAVDAGSVEVAYVWQNMFIDCLFPHILLRKTCPQIACVLMRWLPKSVKRIFDRDFPAGIIIPVRKSL
jgi:hypothetical protein